MKRVLIVEDNYSYQKAVMTALKNNYDIKIVEVTPTLSEMIKSIKQNLADDNVLLLDHFLFGDSSGPYTGESIYRALKTLSSLKIVSISSMMAFDNGLFWGDKSDLKSGSEKALATLVKIIG